MIREKLKLGDFVVLFARCSHCKHELPQTARADSNQTSGGLWIVVLCPRCDYWTPFKVIERKVLA